MSEEWNFTEPIGITCGLSGSITIIVQAVHDRHAISEDKHEKLELIVTEVEANT
jgi:hypothetical protein